MITASGQDATNTLTHLVKSLKDNHLVWSAIIVKWEGQVPPPWQNEESQLLSLRLALKRILGKEGEKSYFLALPSGSLVVLSDLISNENYQKALSLIQGEMQNLPCSCYAFDLSVAWTDFMTLCREVYQAAPIIPQKQGYKPETKDQLLTRLETRLKGATELFKSRPRKMTLLFVEDEPSIRQLLASMLATENFQLRFAGTGEEAIQSYADLPPHIVFLDINLPDITGLQVLDMISKYDTNAYPIMLTGNASETDVTFAKNHGIKGYIVKPFSWQKLSQCLERYQAMAKGSA